jgi:hypothetical protein
MAERVLPTTSATRSIASRMFAAKNFAGRLIFACVDFFGRANGIFFVCRLALHRVPLARDHDKGNVLDAM